MASQIHAHESAQWPLPWALPSLPGKSHLLASLSHPPHDAHLLLHTLLLGSTLGLHSKTFHCQILLVDGRDMQCRTELILYNSDMSRAAEGVRACLLASSQICIHQVKDVLCRVPPGGGPPQELFEHVVALL
jgi:hypothetical protein